MNIEQLNDLMKQGLDYRHALKMAQGSGIYIKPPPCKAYSICPNCSIERHHYLLARWTETEAMVLGRDTIQRECVNCRHRWEEEVM